VRFFDGLGASPMRLAVRLMPRGRSRAGLRNGRSASRERYWHLCPDFGIELQSSTDRPRNPPGKDGGMAGETARNLGWLIDPENRSVSIYRHGLEPETRTDIAAIAGEGPVDGFVLDLRLVWEAARVAVSNLAVQLKGCTTIANLKPGRTRSGATWSVEFQWQQTAISIRHSDSVDVKYIISTDGEAKQEKVVALPLPDLLAVCAEVDHGLSDPFCLKLASLHLAHMIASFEDMDKLLVTMTRPELLHYAQGLTEKPHTSRGNSFAMRILFASVAIALAFSFW